MVRKEKTEKGKRTEIYSLHHELIQIPNRVFPPQMKLTLQSRKEKRRLEHVTISITASLSAKIGSTILQSPGRIQE